MSVQHRSPYPVLKPFLNNCAYSCSGYAPPLTKTVSATPTLWTGAWLIITITIIIVTYGAYCPRGVMSSWPSGPMCLRDRFLIRQGNCDSNSNDDHDDHTDATDDDAGNDVNDDDKHTML